MLGSSVLDVALGLIFVYLLLSIVCTSINEGLSGLFNLRGSVLNQGIRNLLGADQAAVNVSAFYGHPLIQGLHNKARRWLNRPSYISPRTFALTVLDLINPTGAGGPATLQQIRTTVATLPDNLKQPLLLFIDRAGGELTRLHDQLEAWFNEAMDRAAGAYKRSVQAIIFVLGLVIVVFVNADTIRMARALSTNATLRQAVLEEAKAFAAAPPRAVAPAARSPADTAVHVKADSTVRAIRAIIDTLGGLGLPLGWTLPDSVKTKGAGAHVAFYLLDALSRLPGLLISAFAVSLGAPFWFDLLNRFVNLRASGPPPEQKKAA